jgi:hypothetical protein
MTDHELRIGSGPDFAMTYGKVAYFHRAELRVARKIVHQKE